MPTLRLYRLPPIVVTLVFVGVQLAAAWAENVSNVDWCWYLPRLLGALFMAFQIAWCFSVFELARAVRGRVTGPMERLFFLLTPLGCLGLIGALGGLPYEEREAMSFALEPHSFDTGAALLFGVTGVVSYFVGMYWTAFELARAGRADNRNAELPVTKVMFMATAFLFAGIWFLKPRIDALAQGRK